VSIAGMVQEVSIPSPVATKDKGKAIMQESEQPKKIKKRVQIQMSLDEELALKFETYEDEANPSVTDVDWDDVQAQIQANEDLAQKMLEEERESLYIAERAKLLAELINKIKKLQAAQRYKAIRNKPQTMEEAFMKSKRCLIKFTNMLSHLCQWNQICEKRTKREGLNLQEESSKRQKTREGSEPTEEPKADVLSQENLQQLMIIVPEQEMNVEALQFFDDMLKVFDRDDLVMLWSLVKDRFSSTEPTDDKERTLWVKLKRMFEPDTNDELWELQRYMHDPLRWRLYDTCRVYHLQRKELICSC
nr:hypothetical protein [Tanacetum cinerariifolium]